MAENAKQVVTKQLTNAMAAVKKRENVTHLDTVNFNDIISAFSNYISQFDSIVHEINSTADRLIENWKGRGCNAFEKDCRQVQINLKDISDIMYDLRDALIDAHAEYIKTDAVLSKSFES